MPTVKRIGPYEFHFYSSDGTEPRHIHVLHRDRGDAKFWLEPIRLARAAGFNAKELSTIEKLIKENVNEFIEAWDTFFEGV